MNELGDFRPKTGAGRPFRVKKKEKKKKERKKKEEKERNSK